MPTLHPASRRLLSELGGMALGLYVGWFGPKWAKIFWFALIGLIVLFVLYVDLVWERIAEWRSRR